MFFFCFVFFLEKNHVSLVTPSGIWLSTHVIHDTLYQSVLDVFAWAHAVKDAVYKVQWNSVITYPQAKWKQVRINQSTFYPKRGFPHWQDRFHVFTRTICHGRCFSVLNVVHYSLFVLWNRLSGHRELENVPVNWNRNWKVGWHPRDQKKRTKERAKKCSWRENWYIISDFVPRSVRLIWKKCTCFPICDVRDRRRERYNRVYALSCIRTNRVSLYRVTLRT